MDSSQRALQTNRKGFFLNFEFVVEFFAKKNIESWILIYNAKINQYYKTLNESIDIYNTISNSILFSNYWPKTEKYSNSGNIDQSAM